MSMEDYSLAGGLARDLKQGLKKLEIPYSELQAQHLMRLLEALYKWNKAYNLTAIKQPKEGLKLHLLDSLTLYSSIRNVNGSLSILDVGTGPGFPGLPLAILFPHLDFTLLDSNSKKVRFIRQLVHELGLKNVEPIHERVESLKGRKFDLITSRAFSSLKDMLELTHHLLESNGLWLAMKGDFSKQELEELPHFAEKNSITPVNIPGVDVERCIVELSLNGK